MTKKITFCIRLAARSKLKSFGWKKIAFALYCAKHTNSMTPWFTMMEKRIDNLKKIAGLKD